jgi:hypothetical protein
MEKNFVILLLFVGILLGGCATTNYQAGYGRPVMVQAPSVATGLQGHLQSYGRAQQLVGPQELRVEDNRSQTYLRAVQLDQQAIRDAQRYDLERQRQNQRSVESWSRMVQVQLDASCRRSAMKQQQELARRRQTQSEVRDLNRAIEQAGAGIVRAFQHGR